jgi:hypothetical protein
VSGIKAQWHLADVADEPDPFAKVVYSAGLDVDLGGPLTVLVEAWKRLGYREGRMERVGLICELKNSGQDCLTCPMATLDHDDPLNRLCRLGKDQQTLEVLCERKQENEQAALAEFVAVTAPAAERAEMPADLTELLTAVGL